MNIYYINGEFVDSERASISVRDIIVLRGFGVFDFLITYNRRPFHLQDHVVRLENSARYIGLELKHTNPEICGIVEETVRRNNHHAESNIRIVYSGGVSSDGLTPEGHGILMVMVTPRVMPPQWWYSEGVKIITVDAERFLPPAKGTSYLSAVCAQRLAKKQKAIEAVYVDRHDRLLEATTSNLFFFKKGKLITPDRDILPGITRNVVLELARGRFEIELRDVGRSELNDMEEVFLTASSKEVVPVVEIETSRVCDGRPGRNTREIMRLWREYTRAYGQGDR